MSECLFYDHPVHCFMLRKWFENLDFFLLFLHCKQLWCCAFFSMVIIKLTQDPEQKMETSSNVASGILIVF